MKCNNKHIVLAASLSIGLAATAQRTTGDPTLTEVWKPVPKIITPGITPQAAPSDAIVLFNGRNVNEWTGTANTTIKWKLEADCMTVTPGTGNITTKKSFGDCQLHIEWRSPAAVKGEGQGRGNSGIFLMGLYEVQILDNYNNVTYSNGQAGSMYKQKMPLVNVCRKPGEWQTYDIIFTAPVYNADSSLKSPAKITVLHNGVLIQNNFELWGASEYIGLPSYKWHPSRLPITLQDHGDLVSYRNIWIREL